MDSSPTSGKLEGWQDGPNNRGSWDILWSCVSTLGLCAWTAVHPNIQINASTKSNLSKRLFIMLVAILVPEMLISAAWRQRTEAFELVKKSRKSSKEAKSSRKRRGKQAESSTTSQPMQELARAGLRLSSSAPGFYTPQIAWTRNWNEKQAFFAVMGGFAVENEYRGRDGNTVTIKNLFTHKGVLLLAQGGCLPELSSEDVEERSNADFIAKIIVIGQVTWFATEVVSRLISRIPVTPLEAHTVVHVGCALVMYLMWWEKPYNVDRSIFLTDATTKRIAALLIFRDLLQKTHQRDREEYERERERYWRNRVVNASEAILTHSPPPTPPVPLSIDEALDKYIGDDQSLADAEEVHSCMQHTMRQLAPDAKTALEKLQSEGPQDMDELVAHFNRADWVGIRQTSQNFMLRSVWGAWTSNIGHEMSPEKWIHILFNLLYGAGHLAVWNSHFPTHAEQWLWRSSALMLAAVPVWGALWILWWKAVGARRKSAIMFHIDDLEIVAGPFFCALIAAYTLARCYFLAESLASLRLLPKKAYDQVDWTKLLPHVG